MIPQDNPWFEACFDALDQFVGILDENGRVIRANRAALAITGLTQAEVTGIPLWLIPWPALKKQSRQALQRAVIQAGGGISSHNELEIRRPTQPGMTFEFSVKSLQDQHGPLKLLVVEGHDITAYRRASEALYQSESRFKTIFEEAGIGIVIKGINGKMLDCNPAFQAMVGYSADELCKRDYLEITHPLDKRVSRKLFNELVAGKRKNYFLEKRYIHKDGQTVWGRMATSLVRGQGDAAKFVIGMVENITTHKQIEAELNEMQHRLMEGRDKERLSLARDLHDGPLQEIIGVSYQVQELENSLQKEASREQLQGIRSALQQLMRSVRSICGELRPPTLVPFGLEKTILSHVEEFRADHPDVKVSYKLAHDGLSLPENVRIVLYRIFQEVFNNIVRHARAKTVKIRFTLSEQKAMLQIQDDGVGFELPDHWIWLARQGHLGLVGAMERAREVGGTLEVNSRPGQGTRIRITVPLKEKVSSTSAQETASNV